MRLDQLDSFYERYNKPEWVHPDPLELVLLYDDLRDREVAGLVASCLAYGRVEQILRSVSLALGRMPEPARFLKSTNQAELRTLFCDFRHRYTSGEELAILLGRTGELLRKKGSLNGLFLAGMKGEEGTVVSGFGPFVNALKGPQSSANTTLLPDPRKGSACKRLNLFLRWMVRKDEVDPGGWVGIHPKQLIVPLDVHMHRIGLRLGLTSRKQADLKAAVEMTRGFPRICPEDPVRYDFALTRSAILEVPVPKDDWHCPM